MRLPSVPPVEFAQELHPKSLTAAFCCTVILQLSTYQKRYGGSVWESNPPFDPRRTESPALKAGKITGPLSLPLLQYHQNKTFS